MIKSELRKICDIAKLVLIAVILQRLVEFFFAYMLHTMSHNNAGMDIKTLGECAILAETVIFAVVLSLIYNKNFSFWTNPFELFKENKAKCFNDIIAILLAVMIINNITSILLPESAFVDYSGTEEILINKKSWISFMSVVIAGPIYEEIAYRGCIFSVIKKYYGSYAGILISSALWAMMHPSLLQKVNTFFLGLVCAWYYNKNENLWIVVIPHILNNLSAFYI